MKTKKVTLIYSGTVEANGGTRQQYYHPENDEYYLFKKKLLGLGAIGIRIHCEREGNTFMNQEFGQIVQPGEDHYEKISDWSAAHRARLEMKKIESEAKKPHPESVENSVLKIKDSMWNMNRKEKAAFALWVYNQLI